MKTPVLQNKRVGVLRMAFGARKVFGTFETWAPGLLLDPNNLKLVAQLHLGRGARVK